MRSAVAAWVLLTGAADVKPVDRPAVVQGPMCTPDDALDSGRAEEYESTSDPPGMSDGSPSPGAMSTGSW